MSERLCRNGCAAAPHRALEARARHRLRALLGPERHLAPQHERRERESLDVRADLPLPQRRDEVVKPCQKSSTSTGHRRRCWAQSRRSAGNAVQRLHCALKKQLDSVRGTKPTSSSTMSPNRKLKIRPQNQASVKATFDFFHRVKVGSHSCHRFRVPEKCSQAGATFLDDVLSCRRWVDHDLREVVRSTMAS